MLPLFPYSSGLETFCWCQLFLGRRPCCLLSLLKPITPIPPMQSLNLQSSGMSPSILMPPIKTPKSALSSWSSFVLGMSRISVSMRVWLYPIPHKCVGSWTLKWRIQWWWPPSVGATSKRSTISSRKTFLKIFSVKSDTCTDMTSTEDLSRMFSSPSPLSSSYQRLYLDVCAYVLHPISGIICMEVIWTSSRYLVTFNGLFGS